VAGTSPQCGETGLGRNAVKPFLYIALVAGFLMTGGAASAQDIRTERVAFPAGASGTTIEGTITGRESVSYVLGARAGQTMSVRLTTASTSTYFNVYEPGRGPGDEALAVSEIMGPMAAIIVGGLVSSTVLNLLLLPTILWRFGRREFSGPTHWHCYGCGLGLDWGCFDLRYFENDHGSQNDARRRIRGRGPDGSQNQRHARPRSQLVIHEKHV
jgi:hypothetical protein